MTKPLSLVPPRPGDGSGICEPRDDDQTDYGRPDPSEWLRPCAKDDCSRDLAREYPWDLCRKCRDVWVIPHV